MPTLTGRAALTSWVLQLTAAGILLQTLFFKFTGAEESRFIFERLGAEPTGRVASGMVELIAAVLLLIPRTAVYGALLGAGIMCGAIAAHLTRLGVVVKNDHGLLFGLACVVLVASVGVVFIRRGQLPVAAVRARRAGTYASTR